MQLQRITNFAQLFVNSSNVSVINVKMPEAYFVCKQCSRCQCSPVAATHDRNLLQNDTTVFQFGMLLASFGMRL